ncbi:N-6 DNA methylase [Candidatus Saccharibacteria bacterium]|nr:N-6 DNA methylase [Candidatus Saccharibacteria bacterium]
MNAQEIQNIVEARYNRASWLKLLHGVFGAKVKFFAAPTTLTVEKAIASEAVYLGDVTLQDDHKIAVYEVHLSEHVNIERNRAGIRNLLCSQWRGAGFAGAFMLCYRNSESVLRFSYVSESWAFNDDGAYKKESTDALRFTYLLGEGHRSRTAVRQFMELANSGLTLKDVTKAFSVEALSKRFFNEYKEKYEDIVEYVTGKRVVKSGGKWETKTTGVSNKKIMTAFSVFADPEKAVRDYVKKLMGRLVFIQFLQKKGWMGVPASDAAWKNGDKDFVQNLFKNTKNKDSFIDDVLEPLFDDLNTKRENDLVSSEMVGKGIKVPYLNGGLFEKDAQDNTEFPLPKKYMEELLEFFTQYNFTIDENDPDDAEVGVDPEMLSCIFENLLEDNKEKGAFYTPKEIVQYMCRESLIAHLCNGVKKNETKERIRDFVLTHKVDVLNGDEDISEQVDEKLKNVKICDPAIGSGAFPMGLMRELYFCRSAIEGFDHAKAAEIKKHIIQQNIYGVDIEKGAVDIARLRFWLSLIVDEETPHALPNLDFKIMQGNSLLEQYEGVDLSDITYNATKKEKVTGKILDLFDTGEVANKKVISLLKDEFFNCEDHEMKRQIREALKSRIQDLLREKGFGVKLDAIKDVTATDRFFLWHTWFSEVFEQGGFDIVIGNPPYVFARDSSEKGITPEMKKIFYNSFNLAKYQVNLYHLFVEQGVNLLASKGIFSYIIPNNWLTINTNKELRKFVLEKSYVQIVNFYKKVFDNADVDSSILLLRNENNKNGKIKLFEAIEKDKIELIKETDCLYFLKQKDFIINMELFKNNSFALILNKIENNSRELRDVADVKAGLCAYEVGAGIPAQTKEMKDNRIYHSNKKESRDYYKYLDGNDVKRYLITWERKEYLKYGKNLAAPRNNFDLYSTPRILVRQIPSKPPYCINACYTEETILNDRNSMNVIYIKENPKYILGVLNSKAESFWFAHKFGKLQRGLFPQFKINELAIFPIPSTNQQQPIIDIVDKILAAKKANPQADTADLEKQIDQLVYKLYNLTPAEIETIEKS